MSWEEHTWEHATFDRYLGDFSRVVLCGEPMPLQPGSVLPDMRRIVVFDPAEVGRLHAEKIVCIKCRTRLLEKCPPADEHIGGLMP